MEKDSCRWKLQRPALIYYQFWSALWWWHFQVRRSGWNVRGTQPFFNLRLNIGKEIRHTAYRITTRHPIKSTWAFMQNPGRNTVSKKADMILQLSSWHPLTSHCAMSQISNNYFNDCTEKGFEVMAGPMSQCAGNSWWVSEVRSRNLQWRWFNYWVRFHWSVCQCLK